MTGPAPETDIVALLLQDHAAIEELLAGYEGLGDEQREDRFRELVHQLVRHEVAEERVVYPAVRLDVLPGEEVAQALLQQETEIELLLDAARKLDSGSDQLHEVLELVKERLLEHIRSEELHLLPLLRKLEADERRWELGYRYLKAVRSAPTRPHPHAPRSRAGLAVAGPIAAVIDWARDLVEQQVAARHEDA